MNWGRYGHGCAKFLMGKSNQPMAIVAGGQPWLQTVEVLDLNHQSKGWKEVKSLKLIPSRSYFPMVTSANGKDLFIIGGLSTKKKGENGILKMICSNDNLESCKWNLSGRLNHGRSSHVAIPITDAIAKKLCN